MKKSTAELALDALKGLDEAFCSNDYGTSEGRAVGRCALIAARSAIAALESELAQPEKAVLWWRTGATTVLHNISYTAPDCGPWTPLYAAPQEPAGWIKATDDLPPLDVPVFAMCGVTTPEMFPMMRTDSGDGEWLWAAYQGGAIDDPRSYEADDDYCVVSWTPLPAKATQ